MRYRRSIRLLASIAWLAAWPIAIYFAKTRFPDAFDAIVLAWLILVVGCAIFLRSLPIAGALAGLAVGLFLTAPFICTIIGALGGWSCQAGMQSRTPSAKP